MGRENLKTYLKSILKRKDRVLSDILVIVFRLLEKEKEINDVIVDWEPLPNAQVTLMACSILFILCPDAYFKQLIEPEKIITAVKKLETCGYVQLVFLFLKWIYKDDLPAIPNSPLSRWLLDELYLFSGIKLFENFINGISATYPNCMYLIELTHQLSEEDMEEKIIFRGLGCDSECP